MRLRQVADILGADILCGRDKLGLEIYYAFSSDLMSDVLSYANKKTLLLTGLINPQVVRTAEMIDMPAIVFVRNKKPGDIIIKLAHENNFVILSTSHSLYTASGLLYASGLKGIQIDS
ncbi:MAG: DRTGG domain-containing protein [Clostridiales bacterium]|nr:DRTGG domain-containing protein [Clostridiales bacterium]